MCSEFENGEGGVGQTVTAPMGSWGEEAARLARGCVPCGLHQLRVAILATRSRPPAGPLGTLWDAVMDIRTAPSHGGHPDDLVEVPMLPPDHYGCGLGCTRSTGTLAAVEEHERRCAHWLHDLLPEGLQRDLFSCDEDELALTLLDMVEPLQYSLSVLQKARRHALASPPLVASEEMPPLESADRQPAPLQMDVKDVY